MGRVAFSRSDVWSVALVWAPISSVVISAAVGVPLWAAIGIGAGVTLACTAAHIFMIAAPRTRRVEALEGLAADLWQASGVPAPSGSRPRERAEGVAQSLRDVRRPLLARVDQSAADLSDMRAVFDATPGPTIATDSAGVVIACNRAAEELTDRRAAQLLGRSFDQVFTHAEVVRMHGALARGERGPISGEVDISRPGGVRTFQVLTAPVRLSRAGGAGVIVTMRDVTDLARAVQLKTDFVANASHELRTPLATIRLSAETLEDGAWEDETMRARLMGVIRTNVQRLEELVLDLLDLSRLETPEAPVARAPFAFADAEAALRADFRQVCTERKLSLSFEVDPRVGRLTTDPKLVTLILKNLVENATKFAFEGTAVRVLGVPLGNDGVEVRVVDVGLGIPLDEQPRIFERFYQVDPSRDGFASRRGTGLGLAIVKHAVKALGGTIRVESVWKQGTTMIVELPGCVRFSQNQG